MPVPDFIFWSSLVCIVGERSSRGFSFKEKEWGLSVQNHNGKCKVWIGIIEPQGGPLVDNRCKYFPCFIALLFL